MLRLMNNSWLRDFRCMQKAHMSWESKRDHEAIVTYNKLLKQPLQDTEYTVGEIRQAKQLFEKIRQYREKSMEGFEPSKLFMVWRVDNLCGRPHWEKNLIIELGIHRSANDYAIVKNTPSMNKKLWSIKHLIRIKPITFPNGFPQSEDFTGTLLKQSGELVVSERLKVPQELLAEDPEQKRKHLEPSYISEDLRLKWDVGYRKMY